jgi:uncharacterized protein
VRIDGIDGDRYAHAAMLEGAFRGRTVVLSPFDDLISDRDRTEALFDFLFRLEIYVPKAKRRWGYFVLPILDGDRLIGRIDPRFDRRTGVLHLNAVHTEAGVGAESASRVSKAIAELARWLGADSIEVRGEPPAAWRSALLEMADGMVAEAPVVPEASHR